MEITEEQRRRAEANRLAALEKRKRAAESSQQPDAWRLFKCPKIAPAPPLAQKPPPPPPPGFRVVLEICSPDEFSVSPEPLDESPFPGETECLITIENCLLPVVPFSLTQSQNGHLSSIFKLSDYDQVVKCLKKLRQIKIQDIPYKTRLVVQKFAPCTGISWIPLMEGHCTDEQVEDLLSNLPASLRNALLPFQLEGVRFGLRRGGRCLIADEMGLGKTLQVSDLQSILNSDPVLVFSWVLYNGHALSFASNAIASK